MKKYKFSFFEYMKMSFFYLYDEYISRKYNSLLKITVKRRKVKIATIFLNSRIYIFLFNVNSEFRLLLSFLKKKKKS